jgi:hypothetical protein
MRIYGAINKVERDADGVLIVSGVASSEGIDSDGEVVRADAMRAALPDYMTGGSGPLREMHQPIAAGVVTHAEVRQDGTTYIQARVVDRQAVAKVDEGVLRGFSIGGRVTARDPEDRKVIIGLRLTEISLVDRPANAECVFKLAKGAGVDVDATPATTISHEDFMLPQEPEAERASHVAARRAAQPNLAIVKGALAQPIRADVRKALADLADRTEHPGSVPDPATSAAIDRLLDRLARRRGRPTPTTGRGQQLIEAIREFAARPEPQTEADMLQLLGAMSEAQRDELLFMIGRRPLEMHPTGR